MLPCVHSYGKISTFLGTDEAMTRQTVGLSFCKYTLTQLGPPTLAV